VRTLQHCWLSAWVLTLALAVVGALVTPAQNNPSPNSAGQPQLVAQLGDIRPTGRYTVSGTNVPVTVRLRRDGAEIANLQITGSRDDLAALIEKIIVALKEKIGNLP
jgi:hypothetical protein